MCETSSMAWMVEPFPEKRKIFSNKHDVMDTLVHPFSTRISGADKATVEDELTVIDFKSSVPEVAEKRE